MYHLYKLTLIFIIKQLYIKLVIISLWEQIYKSNYNINHKFNNIYALPVEKFNML
jgi:hypothetical protein